MDPLLTCLRGRSVRDSAIVDARGVGHGRCIDLVVRSTPWIQQIDSTSGLGTVNEQACSFAVSLQTIKERPTDQVRREIDCVYLVWLTDKAEQKTAG